MRELTFSGFVREYLQTLEGNGCLNLRTLCLAASDKNPRLKEPLLLYALAYQKQGTLLRAANNTRLYGEYTVLLEKMGAQPLEQSLSEELWPEEYQKVWRSYQSRKNRFRTDDETKRLMRKRLVELQNETGLSNYRIYTDLKLNPGNVNAWLKHDDGSKVSLAVARQALQYVRQRRVG